MHVCNYIYIFMKIGSICLCLLSYDIKGETSHPGFLLLCKYFENILYIVKHTLVITYLQRLHSWTYSNQWTIGKDRLISVPTTTALFILIEVSYIKIFWANYSMLFWERISIFVQISFGDNTQMIPLQI